MKISDRWRKHIESPLYLNENFTENEESFVFEGISFSVKWKNKSLDQIYYKNIPKGPLLGLVDASCKLLLNRTVDRLLYSTPDKELENYLRDSNLVPLDDDSVKLINLVIGLYGSLLNNFLEMEVIVGSITEKKGLVGQIELVQQILSKVESLLPNLKGKVSLIELNSVQARFLFNRELDNGPYSHGLETFLRGICSKILGKDSYNIVAQWESKL